MTLGPVLSEEEDASGPKLKESKRLCNRYGAAAPGSQRARVTERALAASAVLSSINARNTLKKVHKASVLASNRETCLLFVYTVHACPRGLYIFILFILLRAVKSFFPTKIVCHYHLPGPLNAPIEQELTRASDPDKHKEGKQILRNPRGDTAFASEPFLETSFMTY